MNWLAETEALWADEFKLFAISDVEEQLSVASNRCLVDLLNEHVADPFWRGYTSIDVPREHLEVAVDYMNRLGYIPMRLKDKHRVHVIKTLAYFGVKNNITYEVTETIEQEQKRLAKKAEEERRSLLEYDYSSLESRAAVIRASRAARFPGWVSYWSSADEIRSNLIQRDEEPTIETRTETPAQRVIRERRERGQQRFGFSQYEPHYRR